MNAEIIFIFLATVFAIAIVATTPRSYPYFIIRLITAVVIALLGIYIIIAHHLIH